jgi:hypothetical protein
MSLELPRMKCGHQGIALHGENRVCPICFGLTPLAEEIDTVKIDLSNRKARCVFCGREEDSDLNLPFFEYHGEQELDSYYCGCKAPEGFLTKV